MACRQKIKFDDFLTIKLLERFYPNGGEAGNTEYDEIARFLYCYDLYGSCSEALSVGCNTQPFNPDDNGIICNLNEDFGLGCRIDHNICIDDEMGEAYYKALYQEYLNSDESNVVQLAQQYGYIYDTDEVCDEVVETDNSKLYLGIGAVALGLGIAFLLRKK